MKHRLQSHPAHPPPAGLRVEVRRLRPDDRTRPLRLAFELFAGPDAVRVPAPLDRAAPRRADGLWQHTCFEAFVAAPAAPANPSMPAGSAAMDAAADSAAGVPYVEFNLAPSGAWAIYRFEDYRGAMRPESVGVEPQLVVSRQPGVLRVEVALAWPVPLPGQRVADTAPAATPSLLSTSAAAPALPGASEAWRGRLGLSAVVEAADGSLSYWALHHPAARPDFHNGEGFALGIEVPE